MGGVALNPLVVLGATGSIGRQTLDVAVRLDVPVIAIAARTPSEALLATAERFPHAVVCVTEPGEYADMLRDTLGERARLGPGSITEVAATPGSTVVNGVVGAVGLRSSLAALYAGNRLALANKESLVAGGSLVMKALEEGGGELIPVDSEHSAIYQCLVGEDPGTVARLVLTASGGPFRGRSVDELSDVTPDDALAHPTWSMGPRISIDSATLMNKAFEVIEAHHLFGIDYDDIDVVVHPESIVHSFVEFVDGVVKAEVGFPDMRKPIAYAITTPERREMEHEPVSFSGTTFTFEEPDRAVFPSLDLGYAAGRAGGTATAVLNAADEVAVGAFLEGRISFLQIAEVVGEALSLHDARAPDGIEDVEAADAEGRARAREACERMA